jgi:hypothetical protein
MKLQAERLLPELLIEHPHFPVAAAFIASPSAVSTRGSSLVSRPVKAWSGDIAPQDRPAKEDAAASSSSNVLATPDASGPSRPRQ